MTSPVCLGPVGLAGRVGHREEFGLFPKGNGRLLGGKTLKSKKQVLLENVEMNFEGEQMTLMSKVVGVLTLGHGEDCAEH